MVGTKHPDDAETGETSVSRPPIVPAIGASIRAAAVFGLSTENAGTIGAASSGALSSRIVIGVPFHPLLALHRRRLNASAAAAPPAMAAIASMANMNGGLAILFGDRNPPSIPPGSDGGAKTFPLLCGTRSARSK